MPKLYYPSPDVTQPAKALDERQWFRLHQPLLIPLVNTDEGRALMEIDPDLPTIIEIQKNMVRCLLEPGHHLSEFRIGAKYGNVIRYRWRDFAHLARDFYTYPEFGLTQLAGGLVAATVTTFYPDPHPESTTVDGRAGWSSSGESWATVRAAAGNSSDDNTSNRDHAQIYVESSGLRIFNRAHFLFNTASIPDTDTIDSAVFSLYEDSAEPDEGGTSDDVTGGAMALLSGSPASDTAIVNGDYAQANFGSTRLAADLDLTDVDADDYSDVTLNAAGKSHISKTSLTRFGTRNALDIDDADPGTSSYNSAMSSFFADQTGTSKDPKLAVTHTTPSVARRGHSGLVGTYII